jgi:hypothetical protein
VYNSSLCLLVLGIIRPTTLLFYQSFIVESSHRGLRRVASFRPYKSKQVGDTGPVESARRSNSRALGSPFSGLTDSFTYVKNHAKFFLTGHAQQWRGERGETRAGRSGRKIFDRVKNSAREGREGQNKQGMAY